VVDADASATALPRAVDTVIIGAGAAGLALGARLADAGTSRSVLLVDARHDYRDDRTWSFWAAREHPLDHLVTQAWPAWRFAWGSHAVDHAVPGLAYQAIRGIDYYRDAQARILASSAVALRLGVTVTDVVATPAARATAEARITVRTSAGEIDARYVVDTRPVSTPATLFQCFVGAEVEHGGALHVGSDALNPATAGLMTRMRADAEGFVFTYVLPLTPTRALIELTRFSASPISLDAIAVERDCELVSLGLGDAPVLREEAGVLPMGADPVPAHPVPGVVRAGNSGGALRAATGYAFARIQAWADDCAAAMVRGEAPLAHPAEPFVRQQMDRIFLQALREHPERTPEYFAALARGVDPARLVRFLTDQASATDLAAIILALPFTPFLAQIPDRTGRLHRSELRMGSAPRDTDVRELVS
jgi:lycopene beta-cyclase